MDLSQNGRQDSRSAKDLSRSGRQDDRSAGDLRRRGQSLTIGVRSEAYDGRAEVNGRRSDRY